MSTITFKKFVNYLHELYKPKDGYVTYTPELLKEAEKENVALTYGEILPQSLDIIINKLDINKKDVFYDLGSGVGKVALQFCLTTPIHKSYGIEALEIRHKIAEQTYIDIKKKIPDLFINKSLQSIHENFLSCELNKPSIIFIDSLCFSDDTIKQLSKVLNNIPTIKYVISLKTIKLNNLKLKEKITLEFSWSRGNNTTTVHIYAK